MAYPKINIRALQAFIAVFEEQSFSRAAERENATQSGMSTQVKNLETALATPLLDRGKGKFTLTKAGQEVYDHGQNILKDLYGLEQIVQGLDGAITGLIRFGMIPTLNRAVLPPSIQSFTQNHQNVEISVLEEYSFSLMRKVVEGELSFAIVPSGEVLPGLTSNFLARDREFVVSASDQFPAMKQLSPMEPAALNGVGLIMPSKRNIRRKQLDTYFESHGVRLGGILEMDGMLATLEFVAKTEWCAVLPSVLCHPDRDGQIRKLYPIGPPSISTDYIVVQKSDKALPKAAALLVQEIRLQTEKIVADWPDGTIRNSEARYQKQLS